MIDTSLTGRLRNTNLPRSRPLLPLLEAVVNSIQSIDSRHENAGEGRIDVRVLRSDEADLFDSAPEPEKNLKPIAGFQIQDNGEGFNELNMKSFLTLDSEQKIDRGGRGVGRLQWLKAFKQVDIRSEYVDASRESVEIAFSFTATDGVVYIPCESTERADIGTTVSLAGFDETLRANAPKQASPIARAILEHCLSYFLREGGAPHIRLIDYDETVSLDDVFGDYTTTNTKTEAVRVSRHTFELIHLKLKPTAKSIPHLHWCAASRDVVKENLAGRIPGLHGRLTNDDGTDFMYACYLTSPYLDENVRAERTAFDIPENGDETLHDLPTMSEIRTAVHGAIERHLHPVLAASRQAGRDRVESFVKNKAPRYRPILPHISEAKLSVNPGLSEKELEVTLHGYLADIERELLVEGHEVLNPKLEQGEEEYQAHLQHYLTRLKDMNMSDLAGYVTRRRVVLDLLQKAIEAGEDGRYQREEVIHSLIMPMGQSSEDSDPSAANLWLIDEGLAFHDYLSSDKPLSSTPITTTQSLQRPDLLCLNAVDNPTLVSDTPTPPLASITVVEIKRPMRNDAKAGEDKNPIEQAQGYLAKIREGKVQTARGRPIPDSQSIPGFIYIIADLTTTMIERCRFADLTRTQDGQAWFGYHGNLNTYIEVMSFDRLHRNATRRNRAFFDKLGLPSA